MKNVIRLGDAVSDGGVVTSGYTPFVVEGVKVARVGDSCTCPKNGHVDCHIAEGDPNFIVDGRPVAFDGHKTSCGETLQSSLSNFGSV